MCIYKINVLSLNSEIETEDDLADVEWFKQCIVKYFGLQPTLPNQAFLKPQFEDYFKPPNFEKFEVGLIFFYVV